MLAAGFTLLHRLYDWVLSWSESKWGVIALFFMAFAEASFFPIPPDVLLIALALSRPKMAWFYGLVSTAGSAIGGMFGYFIGWKLMELIGYPIINFYGVMDTFQKIKVCFQNYDFWLIGTAGFTPIPYKVFTIGAGACSVSFAVFLVASVLSRGLRFFIIAGLIYKFGWRVRGFIDRYFNLVTVIFVVLLLGGFLLVKLVVKR